VTRQSFTGKTAFITGAAVGLGRAFARALTARGANAVIAEIDVEGAGRTAAELNTGGARAIAVPCDVADERQVEIFLTPAGEALKAGIRDMRAKLGCLLPLPAADLARLRTELRGLADGLIAAKPE